MPLKSSLELFFFNVFSVSSCHGCFSISHWEEQMTIVLGCHDDRNKIGIDWSYLIEWLLISPKAKTSKIQLFSKQVLFLTWWGLLFDIIILKLYQVNIIFMLRIRVTEN